MSDLTPMMQQYFDTKKKCPDAILFFRLGDFYEMFGEDAKIASSILQIALTARSAGEGRKMKMPMCGIPFHAANAYVMKIISSGRKVAICEQVEDPKAAKGIVRREIIKIITPGTVLEDAGLERKTNNYLLAVAAGKDKTALAYVDASTGEFCGLELPLKFDLLADETEKIGPTEVLVPESWKDDREITKLFIDRLRFSEKRIYINYYPDYNFHFDTASEALKEHFGASTLEGFGLDGKKETACAAGAVIHYLKETQKTLLFHINKISILQQQGIMVLDSVTLKNLEITGQADKAGLEGGLCAVLDYTATAMGGRELKKWLKAPLADLKKIKERQEIVRFFVDFSDSRSAVSALLGEISDTERIAGKLGSSGINGRDLIALKKSIESADELDKFILNSGSENLKRAFKFSGDKLRAVAKLIGSAINEEPPISIKEGGVIKAGYSPEVKKLRELSENGRAWIAQLQETERKRSRISSLKVGYTSVFGYYIEISKANLKNVPENYIRKQTLVNAERFVTPELKEYEANILGAQEKIRNMEYEIFCAVRDEIAKSTAEIQALSARLAAIDCLVSLATAAVNNNYTCPEVDSSESMEIEEGRHPVVEKAIGYNEFIANDTLLDTKENMIMMITGPNMAGKSTYMRQAAVIAVMAQAGSFIPAKRARIGLIDRVFTRVGASDYLSRGQSTFMVEMIETANILNNATKKSLILLDEVGRGTSTFDGVSIAWAITEFIHNKIKARTLFATHYYELTELADLLSGVKNYSVQVKEWGDKIVFLRKIVKGSTDRSYGIHVAQLAGVPSEATQRAKEILSDLEKANYTKDGRPKIGSDGAGQAAQPDLFSFAADDELKKAINEVNVDELTPVQALLKLKELKDKYK